ncbi:MAG: hypothetical protein Q8K36_03415, partial [Alphaproteobacteria bacterium]|nr:hypothetical protein [Alphaproteobacteria bacterium]
LFLLLATSTFVLASDATTRPDAQPILLLSGPGFTKQDDPKITEDVRSGLQSVVDAISSKDFTKIDSKQACTAIIGFLEAARHEKSDQNKIKNLISQLNGLSSLNLPLIPQMIGMLFIQGLVALQGEPNEEQQKLACGLLSKVTQNNDGCLEIYKVAHPQYSQWLEEMFQKEYRLTVSTFVPASYIQFDDSQIINPKLFFGGKFGLKTFLEAFFKGDYLIGLTSRGYTAHGLTMNPLDAILHDIEHCEFYHSTQRHNMIKAFDVITYALHHHYGVELSTERLKKIQDFVEYERLRFIKALESAYHSALARYTRPEDQEKLARFIVGLFYLIHESAEASLDSIFELDLEKILQIDTQNALYTVNQMTKECPINSDPNTGTSPLSQEEIIEKMLAEINFTPDSICHEDTKLIQESAIQYSLRVHHTHGKVKSYGLLTRVMTMGNMKDHSGLLKLANITVNVPNGKISMPEFERVQSNFKHGMSTLINEFMVIFSEIIQHPTTDETTLAQQFAKERSKALSDLKVWMDAQPSSTKD